MDKPARDSVATPTRRLRRRFWIQAGLAAASAIAFLALLNDPVWIWTLTGLDLDIVRNSALEWLLPVVLLVIALIPPRASGGVVRPTRLARGVLLGVVVWIASAYSTSRLVGATNFPQSLDGITLGNDFTWWWAGAVAGVLTAIVTAGTRRIAAVAVTAGLTVGFGLLAWQVVWAYARSFE